MESPPQIFEPHDLSCYHLSPKAFLLLFFRGRYELHVKNWTGVTASLQSCRDAVYPRAVPFTPLHLSQYSTDVTWTLAHGSPSKPPWICISGEDEGMRKITFWAGRWKRKVVSQLKVFPILLLGLIAQGGWSPFAHSESQTGSGEAWAGFARLARSGGSSGWVSPGPRHTLTLSEMLTWLHLGLSVAEQMQLGVAGGREHAISYFNNISVLLFGMWKGK